MSHHQHVGLGQGIGKEVARMEGKAVRQAMRPDIRLKVAGTEDRY
jgi:hypothetical protein